MSEIECVAKLPPNPQFAQRYLPRTLLGVGGVGEVTLYADRWIGREVALKTLRPSGDGVNPNTERFLREARVQGQLEHPSIVPVYECGIDPDGREYFTMKRVRGPTLADILKRRAESGEQADGMRQYGRRRLLEAFTRVCLAVDFAHSRGVLHRDLKPSNVMLGDFGEVYVLDWGVAKVLGTSDGQGSTAAPSGMGEPGATEQGAWLGTPGYMAPEQIDGGPVDTRTDVYALGAMLFEIVTGRPLHDLGRPVDVVRSTLTGVDARPSCRFPDTDWPPEFDSVLSRATATDPALRYRSARALAEDMERFLDGDRDLMRRREMAARHVETARAALGEVDRDRISDQQRSLALRNAGRALALDPGNVSALELLGQLLLQEPRPEPAEVRAAIEENAAALRVRAMRTLAVRSLAWLVCVPLSLLIGYVNVPASIAVSVSVITVALLIAAACRLRTVSVRTGLFFLVAITLLFALLSSLFGPFILVPPMITINTIFFVLHSQPGQRKIILAMGVLAMVGPFLAELLHLVPPSCEFIDNRIILLPRTLAFPATETALMLLFAQVMLAVYPVVVAARVRDAWLAAERKLFLYSWQVGQLAADLRGAKWRSAGEPAT
jgi:serine/threonine-protein kinase